MKQLEKLVREIVEELVDCDAADPEPVQQYLAWTEEKLRSSLLAELEHERGMRAQNFEIKTLLAEKVKALETKLWDSQQLVDAKTRSQNELRSQISDLEERNRKDMAWRGKRICELDDSLEAANKHIGELEANTTKAIRAVISERQHQHNQGRGDSHDDGYIDGVLALGGAAYAISGAGFNCIGTYRRRAKNLWPFPLETFNPTGNANLRNDLVRGAAMIIAEIDRIDRKAARAERATTSVQDTGIGWMEKFKPGNAE